MPARLRLASPRAIATGLGSGALLTVAGYGTEGCRTATQVTVELRTVGALPCASLRGVLIVVAATPQDAEDKMRLGALSAEVPRGRCLADGKTLGTLVITPGADTGAIIVAARLSDAAEATCKAPEYKGCIVARRSFGFIDHASVTLPISLDIACADVPCGVVTSCRDGTCVSSEAQCSEATGSCDSAAEPVVLPDGGIVPSDGDRPDGGGPADTGKADVTTDAPADAPPDVDPALFGNDCPTSGAPRDCNATGDLCCYMGSYFCTAPASCNPAYYHFECQGRKYCGAGYCCGPSPEGGTPSTKCDTTSGQMCQQTGHHYICTTDYDCPPAYPKCTGIYYNLGTGTTKECQ